MCILPYVGKTVHEFRLRQKHCKMNARNVLQGQPYRQQHLFHHFYSKGHCSFPEDVTITFADKTDHKDLKRREYFRGIRLRRRHH